MKPTKPVVKNSLYGGWKDGWMDGWMAERKEAKAGLRIAYSNQI